jgi:hypothetical protein
LAVRKRDYDLSIFLLGEEGGDYGMGKIII